MQVTLPAGFRLPGKKPGPALEVAPVQVKRAGVSALDCPGMRCRSLVTEGQEVAIGTPLLRDQRSPHLMITSPVAGVVDEIVLTQRRFSALAISVSGDEANRFELSGSDTAEGLRDLMQASGLWISFRERPFSHIPDGARQPAAIFVTAIDNRPDAPDAASAIAAHREDFSRGVASLGLLTQGPVYVCQGAGPDLVAAQIGQARTVVARFPATWPAGLPGTHIARLFPATKSRPVWHIGYPDVVALGALLRTGQTHPGRTVRLAGTGLKQTVEVELPWGADLHALARQFGVSGPKRVMSGDEISGREAQFLGRMDVQASIVARNGHRSVAEWLAARAPRHGAVAPFIPTRALEHAIGPSVPVVPLLRALSVGDVETAARLGCLQLAEEDLALASYLAGGETDFGARLRTVFDLLEAQ